MSITMLRTFVHDANNFTDSGSWLKVNPGIGSSGVIAPDGTHTAYNMVDSFTGPAHLVHQTYSGGENIGNYSRIHMGLFVKNTGVNSAMSFGANVLGAATYPHSVVTWSSNGTASLVTSFPVIKEDLHLVTSDGWWFARTSMPSSGYALDVAIEVSAVNFTFFEPNVGAIAIWGVFAGQESDFVTLEAEYDFKKTTKKITDKVVTSSRKSYEHTRSTHTGVQFTARYVDRFTRDKLLSFWQNQDQLFCFDTYGSFLQPGTLSGKSPLPKVAFPYHDQYDGIINLESF